MKPGITPSEGTSGSQAVRVSKAILLWVTDARGLDSNGEILTIAPRPERWPPGKSN
jgi:hypothetical protein